MHRTKDQAVVTDLGNGVTRKLLIHGGKLMAVKAHFVKGACVALHSHPHEQVGVILQGRFEMTFEGQTWIAEAGDSFYAAPHQSHGARALEDGIVLDVFTPIRDDFLECADRESPPVKKQKS